MDSRLLAYYNRELQHLREMGGEFAREFPKIAGRLALDQFTCADPYVERLLEGFAFLASRVHLKLDAEFPRFTQSLLETVYPQYMAPTPSMCVAQFQPVPTEAGLVDGYAVPRGTALRSLVGPGERTACEYRTAHDVKLFPIKIAEAQYYTRELATLDLPASLKGMKAGVRLRLACTVDKPFSTLKLDNLPLFLRGTSEVQMRLYEQIFARARAFVIQGTTRPPRWREVVQITPESGLRRVGFDDSQALLPGGARSFQGYRLLHEYFSFPQRFMFFELMGLAAGLRQCKENVLDLIVLFNEADLALENRVDASNFVPFCTPAINLFPKRERFPIAERFSEFHAVMDRTRPLDFEIYQVTAVTGYGEGNANEKPFLPFYSARDFEGAGEGAYFTVNRMPRTQSSTEAHKAPRSRYAGSEVFISLVDAKAAPFDIDLRQLSVEALCTNRDLPAFIPIGREGTDFTLDAGGPVQSVRCMSGQPTLPRASLAEGQMAWRLISHLSLNYLSLADTEGGRGAAALRDLLSLYGDLSDAHVRRQIEGIKSVASEPIVRRVPVPGPIAFARGIQETVTFDEAAFEGTGAFLLGAVLEHFFARYVSLNSFTETIVKSVERGQIMHWPARFGRRHLL